jgi:hypothetical protein
MGKINIKKKYNYNSARLGHRIVRRSLVLPAQGTEEELDKMLEL